MSTKQFQAVEDATTAFLEAERRMKEARAEFVKLIRQTGNVLRKDFIDDDRTCVQFIQATIVDYTVHSAAMMVVVGASAGHEVDMLRVQKIENYLRDQGWKIDQIHHETVLAHNRIVMYCI